MKDTIKPYAAVLAAVIFWGISFVATKVVLQGISPYTMLTCRFALAGLLAFPIWFIYGRERIYFGDLFFFFLLGLMEPGLYYLLETWGIVYTSASMASLIIASIPVFVTLLAAFFLKESLRLKVVLGILMTLIGVVSLIWQDSIALDITSRSLFGNVLVLGAAVCASFYTIVSRRLRTRYRTLTLTMVQFGFATLFFLPFAVHEWMNGQVPQLSTEVIVSFLFLALFATLFAFLLYNYGLGGLEASRVAVFINVIPLVTVLTARIYLGEKLSGFQAIGGIFILLGVGLTTMKSGRKAGDKNQERSEKTGFRLSAFLNGRTHKRSLSLIATKDYVKGPDSAVVRTGGCEGKHQAL